MDAVFVGDEVDCGGVGETADVVGDGGVGVDDDGFVFEAMVGVGGEVAGKEVEKGGFAAAGRADYEGMFVKTIASLIEIIVAG